LKSAYEENAVHDDAVRDAMGLVCELPDAGRHERRLSAADTLRLAATFRETEQGVSITFPGDDDTRRSVFEFVLAEMRCCPRFRYELDFDPDKRVLTFRLGADGALVAQLKALYVGLANEVGLTNSSGL
jgi:hypothetical protein